MEPQNFYKSAERKTFPIVRSMKAEKTTSRMRRRVRLARSTRGLASTERKESGAEEVLTARVFSNIWLPGHSQRLGSGQLPRGAAQTLYRRVECHNEPASRSEHC